MSSFQVSCSTLQHQNFTSSFQTLFPNGFGIFEPNNNHFHQVHRAVWLTRSVHQNLSLILLQGVKLYIYSNFLLFVSTLKWHQLKIIGIIATTPTNIFVVGCLATKKMWTTSLCPWTIKLDFQISWSLPLSLIASTDLLVRLFASSKTSLWQNFTELFEQVDRRFLFFDFVKLPRSGILWFCAFC